MLLHQEGSSSFLCLIDRQSFKRLSIVIEFRQDTLRRTRYQRAGSVTIVLLVRFLSFHLHFEIVVHDLVLSSYTEHSRKNN